MEIKGGGVIIIKSMKGCLFNCGEKCKIKIDWYCNKCNTFYHNACIPKNDVDYRNHKCLKCETPFDKITVGFWALSGGKYIGNIYDVNYIQNGILVAVKPHLYVGGDEWKMRDSFMSANLSKVVRLETIANWYDITEILNSVKVLEK